MLLWIWIRNMKNSCFFTLNIYELIFTCRKHMSYFYVSFSSFFEQKNKINMPKLEHTDPQDLIEIDYETPDEQLRIYLFEEGEEELTRILILDTENSEEETDGAFDLIRNIAEKIKHDIEKVSLNGDLKKFLHTLTKIFTLLLNIKVDTGDKIIKIVTLFNSLIAKKWSERS